MKLSEFKKQIADCDLCAKKNGDLPRVLSPRGNYQSDIIFIVPAPSGEECLKKKLMDYESGRLFEDMLSTVCEFNIFEEALVVPLTFCSTRMSPSCVTNCHQYVKKFIKSTAKLLCIVGNDVYKGYFGEGKIPDMLYGHAFKDEKWEHQCFFFSDYRKLKALNTDGFGWQDPNIEYWHIRIEKEIKLFAKHLGLKDVDYAGYD